MAERRIIKGWIVERRDDGTLVPIAPADQGGQMPADPTFQYEGPQAQATLENARGTAAERAATLPYAGPKAAADARKAEADAAAAELKLKQERDAEAKRGQGAASDAILRVISQIDNIASDAQDNGGLGETGFTGARLRGWEGSAAYDLAQKLKTINANLAFNELQKMRDASPTGGALGQVTENELDLLRSTIANLDPNQSQAEFLGALGRARDSYTSMLGRVNSDLAGRLKTEYDKRGDPLAAYAKGIKGGGTPSDPLEGYVGSDKGPTLGPNGPVDAPPPSSDDRSGSSTGSGGLEALIRGDYGSIDADRRNTVLGAIDAFGRNFANAGSLGMADRIAAAGNAILPLDNLFGADNRSIWDGSSFGQAYDANLGLQRRTNAADLRANPIASVTGDVGGSIAGMVGANALLRRVGGGRLVTRTGGVAGDVGYLAARGGVEDGAMGAAKGAAAGVAGGVLGRYVLGPTVGAIAASRPGQAVINTVERGANAIGNAGRGLIGRGPTQYTPRNLPQALPRGSRAILSRLPDDAAAQLREAQAMGLPMAVADLSPELQALTGSAVRKSPNARTLAEQTLRPRFLGQADRAREQIARNFGPIDNPNEVSENLLQAARRNAGPLYDDFRAQPARTSDELQAMLSTPAGQQALNNARGIAANEGRDPNALGFDLDELGQVVLRRDPSPETLDLVKRGLDDVVSGAQNPLTGRIETDAGRAVEGLRRRYIGEVDRLYPQYAPARAAYAGPAAERAALQRGRDMARAAPRDIEVTMGRMPPTQQDQFRLGQRVEMSDAVDRARMTTNPYQSIWGGTEARNRAGAVFGDQPRANFQRAFDIEDNMGRTFNEALGGSPTQPRAAADEAFDNMVGNVADAGGSLLFGGGGLQELGRNLARGVRDNWRVRGSQRMADEMAPILLNADPLAMARAIEELGRASALRRLYIDNARRTGGLIGSSTAAAAAPSIR